MKSHVNRSPADRLLGQQLLDAVLADERDARLGEHRQVLGRDVLDRRQQLDARPRRGPSAPPPRHRRARDREVLAHHLQLDAHARSSSM